MAPHSHFDTENTEHPIACASSACVSFRHSHTASNTAFRANLGGKRGVSILRYKATGEDPAVASIELVVN